MGRVGKGSGSGTVGVPRVTRSSVKNGTSTPPPPPPSVRFPVKTIRIRTQKEKKSESSPGSGSKAKRTPCSRRNERSGPGPVPTPGTSRPSRPPPPPRQLSDQERIQILREFDLDTHIYGPASGISRLERVERAKKFKIPIPNQILEILKYGTTNKLNFDKCLWDSAL